ncbi:MAG: EAL domain-containing protein [Pseudomonadota bacterium]
MYCADCESLDQYFFESTRFWMFLPTGESVQKALAFLSACGFENTRKAQHCLVVTVPERRIKEFLLGLYGELEPPELGKTKITTSRDDSLSLEDTGRIVTAQVLISRFNGTWLVDIIEQERYETHFQTIYEVDGDNQAHPFAFEGLLRLKDENDNYLSPAHVFRAAGDADLLFSLDLAARRSAVSHFAKAGLRGKLFINFNPSSIYDPAYCLRTTASAINALGIDASDVVFEITETHSVRNESVMKGILSFYRNSGFGVALDDIGSGYSGLNMLHKFKPDYVKIDMDLIRDLHTDPYKQVIVQHLIEIAHQNGVLVIAEGVENKEELNALRRYEPDFYQGFYFSRPVAMPANTSEERQREIDNYLRGVR